MFMNGDNLIVKMSLLPNLMYRFKIMPAQIPASYFVNIDKFILKFIWRVKKHRITKSLLVKNKVGN